FVLVPVHPKLRLNFSEANDWVTRFAYVIAETVEEPETLEWSLDLSTTNDTKRRLRERGRDGTLENADVERVLFAALPRFIWRAQVARGTKVLAELLLDGTAVSRAFPVLHVLFCDAALRTFVRRNLDTSNFGPVVTDELVT